MQTELFYNTIHLTGSDLSQARAKAAKQDDRILEIMRGAEKMTPLQVSRLYNEIYPEAPVTSIRRSMTNLTNQGKLERLEEKVMEKFGMPNFYWKVCE